MLNTIPPTRPAMAPSRDRLQQVARDLEASFLSEMLRSAGLGRARSAFGGGAGEDQFSSFLVDEQARAMVRAGGLGLADEIYQSLKEHDR